MLVCDKVSRHWWSKRPSRNNVENKERILTQIMHWEFVVRIKNTKKAELLLRRHSPYYGA